MDDLVFESFNVQQQIHEELRFNLSKVQGSGFRAFGTFFFPRVRFRVLSGVGAVRL